MKDAELKPCPFCGNKDVDISHVMGEYWVTCYCGSMRQSKQEAVDSWNQRVSQEVIINSLEDKINKQMGEYIEVCHNMSIRHDAEIARKDEALTECMAVCYRNAKKAL